MTLWITMPAYNEAPRLPALFDRWRAVLANLNRDHRFFIVDDGSTDRSANCYLDLAMKEQDKVTVKKHETNKGLGAAMKTLFTQIAQNAAEDDLIVTMDADNTQPPELLPDMLEKMTASNADVIIASRFAPGGAVTGLNAARRITSAGAVRLFRLIAPIPNVRDYTCGYRLYKATVIQNAVRTLGDTFCDAPGFECMAQTLLQLARLEARFDEVGMTLDYTPKDGASHMPVAKTIRKTLRLLLDHRRNP